MKNIFFVGHLNNNTNRVDKKRQTVFLERLVFTNCFKELNK